MAYIAREMQCECVCVVPHGAPRTKLDAVERLGGRLISVPYEEWWATLEQGTDSAVAKAHRLTGLFVHPVADPHVVAGNASVGMEIFEDLDHVDEVARAPPPRARAHYRLFALLIAIMYVPDLCSIRWWGALNRCGGSSPDENQRTMQSLRLRTGHGMSGH